jgi:hypothetical protein
MLCDYILPPYLSPPEKSIHLKICGKISLGTVRAARLLLLSLLLDQVICGYMMHLVVIHILGFRVQGSGFRVEGLGFRVEGFGFRVWGLGFRVSGLEFRVWGLGIGLGV